jgi:uncharacterized membrane protein
MKDIVVVTFNEPSKAYQAFSTLKEIDVSGRLKLRSAVVVERQANGQPTVHDSVDATDLYGQYNGTIGDLLGGYIGLNHTTSIAANIPAGSTGLIAEVDEYAVEVMDTPMSQLGGTVFRKPAAAVDAEIVTANDDYESAKSKEKREKREASRKEHDRERAKKHNERVDRTEHWLEGTKEPIPPEPAASSEATSQS